METYYTDEQDYSASRRCVLAGAGLAKIEPAIAGVAQGRPGGRLSDVDKLRRSESRRRKTGNVFRITKALTVASTRTCATDGTKGCPSSGNW